MSIAAAALAMLIQVSTILSPSGDGMLSAEISFPEARTQIVFEPDNQPQRKLDWSAGDGFTFDGVTLERADGEPFTQAVLKISADSQFFDRKYVAVERIGSEGWALFLPAFAVEEETVSLSLTGFEPSDILITDGARQTAPYPELTIAPDTDDRLAYIGSPPTADDGPITMIAGSNTPADISQRLYDQSAKAISKLTDRFGTAPQTRPLLLIANRDDGSGTHNKASVLANSTMIFHLRNLNESSQDPEGVAERQSFIAVHESVHLWNGGVWSSRVNASQPWLHEGSADYIASRLVGGRSGPDLTMGMVMNGCISALRDFPLDGSRKPITGGAAYDCGKVLQLAAELTSLQNGGGDILDLWSDVFTLSDNDGMYDDTTFLGLAEHHGGEDFAALADLFLTQTGTDRWQRLPDLFTPLGVTISQRTPDEREADALFFFTFNDVMQQFCPDQWGWWMNDRSWKLDTEKRCRSRILDGNPEIDRVNGFHIIDEPFAATQAIRESCENEGEIVFTRLDGVTLPPVTCPAPLPAPVPVIEKVEIPALPPL